MKGLLRTLRYARAWAGGPGAEAVEIHVEREGRRLPATLHLPTTGARRLPGWVVLGGVTRMGRHHPQLNRFAASLAASGAAVIVPEIPEWRDLRLEPEVAAPTLRAGIAALKGRPEVRKGPMGVVGLSFGAPQAALATLDDDLADDVGGVALFGGYCDLERTLRCMINGTHEWEGTEHRLVPDPYGRWVVASNVLTRVPGYGCADDVAEALRTLALAATELRIPAWSPEHDALKAELRPGIAPARRDLFDFFAPPVDGDQPCCEAGAAWAARLADALRGKAPMVEPVHHLHGMRARTRLIHGRADRLIPWTESHRFHQGLPSDVDARLTVTGLFAHSADLRPPSPADRARECAHLFRGIHGLITAV